MKTGRVLSIPVWTLSGQPALLRAPGHPIHATKVATTTYAPQGAFALSARMWYTGNRRGSKTPYWLERVQSLGRQDALFPFYRFLTLLYQKLRATLYLINIQGHATSVSPFLKLWLQLRLDLSG